MRLDFQGIVLCLPIEAIERSNRAVGTGGQDGDRPNRFWQKNKQDLELQNALDY